MFLTCVRGVAQADGESRDGREDAITREQNTASQVCHQDTEKKKKRSLQDGRITPMLVLGVWARTPGYATVPCLIAGIFRPLPVSRHSKLNKAYDSACNIVLSAGLLIFRASSEKFRH